MIQICRAAFASHCHNKSKLESSLRMLLNSNLNSISIAHCGPQVAAYLLQSYTQIGLTDSQFLGTLLTHINSFDVIPTSQAFQIYKDLEQLEPGSLRLSKILTHIQSKHLPMFQQHQLNKMLQRANHNETLEQQLKQLIDSTDTTWKVDYFADGVALLVRAKQQVLVFGKQTTAEVGDFRQVQTMLERMNRKPQVIVETQPITNLINRVPLTRTQSKLTTYSESMKDQLINVEHQVTLEGRDLLSYLQSQVMDANYTHLKNDIAYMRQSFPQINPPITLLYMIAKQYRETTGPSIIHLVDLPQQVFNQNMLQSCTLDELKHLLQICNHLTLVEKLRYLQQHSNTQHLPCAKCNPNNTDINHAIPTGYMNIIDSDTRLYDTSLSSMYTLSQIKRIMNDKDNFVICCGESNFIPILKGVVDNEWPQGVDLQTIKENQLQALSNYDADQLNTHLEKSVILDHIQQQFVGDYLEHLIQQGMPPNETLFSLIAEKTEDYQQQLSLDPLLQNMSEKDQSLFSNLLDEVQSGCLIDEMIFQRQQNIPSARVNKVEKNQVLRTLRDFCG